MSGRHHSQVQEREGWAPTAFNAVVASTPATSLFAALGMAGGGYLAGRADVAGCGAVVGAVGLVVERFQTRGVRRRLRRERAQYRDGVRGVSRDLQDLQQQLAALRDDLDVVRAERDVVRQQLSATMQALTGAVLTPVVAESVVAESVVAESVVAESVVAEPTADLVAGPAGVPAPLAPLAPLGLIIPGQARSPIATGGIPVLVPGPSEPVRVIDLRVAEPITLPVPTLPAETVDALVYAALAEEEADELTRVLEVPGRASGRHADALHTGDAHHAGDYSRDDTAAGGAAILYVVNRGRHVA